MEELPFGCYQCPPPPTPQPTHTHTYTYTRSLHLKASCLWFHSSLYLPQELLHFNINRMLHHSAAQTSPCYITPMALLKKGGHVVGMVQKKGKKWKLYFVMVFKFPDFFVLTGRQNERRCCTWRGDREDVGAFQVI